MESHTEPVRPSESRNAEGVGNGAKCTAINVCKNVTQRNHTRFLTLSTSTKITFLLVHDVHN